MLKVNAKLGYVFVIMGDSYTIIWFILIKKIGAVKSALQKLYKI